MQGLPSPSDSPWTDLEVRRIPHGRTWKSVVPLNDLSQTKILQLATNTKHSNIKPSENTMSNADPFAASSMNSYASNSMGGYGSQYPQGYYQPIQSFDYGRVFTAPFKSPNWVMNVLWSVGCVVLSSVVVGTLV